VRERPREGERGHAYACAKAGDYSKFQQEMEQFRLPRQLRERVCVRERPRERECTRIRVRERGRLLKIPAGNGAVPSASLGVKERERERDYSELQQEMEQFRLPRQVCVCV